MADAERTGPGGQGDLGGGGGGGRGAGGGGCRRRTGVASPETVRILDQRGGGGPGQAGGAVCVTLTLDGLARREGGPRPGGPAVAGELAGLLEGVPSRLGAGGGAGQTESHHAGRPGGPRSMTTPLVTRHLVEGCPEFGGFPPGGRPVRRGAGYHGDGGARAGPGVHAASTLAAILCGDGGRPGLRESLEAAVPHGAAVRYGDRPAPGWGTTEAALDSGHSLGAPVLAVKGPHGEGQGPPWPPVCWDGGTAAQRRQDLLPEATPKDIDSQVSGMAKVIGFMASAWPTLHPGLRVEDLDLLLS